MSAATIFNQAHRLEKDKLLQTHRDTIKKPISKQTYNSDVIEDE